VTAKLYWQALRSSFGVISENNIGLLAAGVAFYAMLSLFPALAALIALLGLISDPAVVVGQLEDMRGLLPGDVYEIISAQVLSLVSASADTLGWAGLVSVMAALWSARAGVGAMMIGLNTVYNERNRNTAWHYLRALGLTIGLVVVGIIAMVALVVLPVIMAFFPLGTVTGVLVDILRYSIAIAVLFAGIGVLYRFGPNRRPARLPWLSAGAVIAVVSWGVLSFGFSYYVANFGYMKGRLRTPSAFTIPISASVSRSLICKTRSAQDASWRSLSLLSVLLVCTKDRPKAFARSRCVYGNCIRLSVTMPNDLPRSNKGNVPLWRQAK